MKARRQERKDKQASQRALKERQVAWENDQIEVHDWTKPLPRGFEWKRIMVDDKGTLGIRITPRGPFVEPEVKKRYYLNGAAVVVISGVNYPIARLAYWYYTQGQYDPGGDNYEDSLGVRVVDPKRQLDMRMSNLLISKLLVMKGKIKMNQLTAGERILKRVRQTSNSSVAKFRESMAIMGMVQINLFVPENGKEEVSLCADKVRAYAMLKLCELPPSDRRRQLLADRNYYSIPTYERIKELDDLVRARGLPLLGDLKALKESVGASLSARGALQHTSGDDEEVFKFSSIGVAHSAIAKYHYDYIMWNLKQ